MFKVTVLAEALGEKSGNAKGSGKPYHFYIQHAMCELNGERRRIQLTHDKPEDALEPGSYFVGPESFFVDGYGSLKLGRPRLVPVTQFKDRASEFLRSAA